MCSIPTLVCLLGPTAAGKTAAAVALAEAYGTAVVSADSRQIYRRMDIGTSKPSAEEQRRAPHHLIDIREPGESYSAAAFERDALPVLAERFEEQPLVVLAGGTGFYVQALLEGSSPLPATPPEVRQAVQADWERAGLPALLEELRAWDPDAYARIDRQNRPAVFELPPRGAGRTPFPQLAHRPGPAARGAP